LTAYRLARWLTRLGHEAHVALVSPGKADSRLVAERRRSFKAVKAAA
jgi:hypothetical protein